MSKGKTANSAVDSLKQTLQSIGAGVAKLAEFATQAPATKAASTPEVDPAVKELASSVAAKLASFGYGSDADVRTNADYMASDHVSALRACESILDVLTGPGNKTGSSPSQLGSVAAGSPAADSPKGKSPQAYRPVRC